MSQAQFAQMLYTCCLMRRMFLISLMTLFNYIGEISYYYKWSNLIFLRFLFNFLYKSLQVCRDISLSSGLSSFWSWDNGSSIFSLIVWQVLILSLGFLLTGKSVGDMMFKCAFKDFELSFGDEGLILVTFSIFEKPSS